MSIFLKVSIIFLLDEYAGGMSQQDAASAEVEYSQNDKAKFVCGCDKVEKTQVAISPWDEWWQWASSAWTPKDNYFWIYFVILFPKLQLKRYEKTWTFHSS